MNNEDDYQRLLNKSKEAFIMGIEIYNKPTIKYRIEGFSFFICNAWELMLKAYLIKNKGDKSIYFNNGRTIPLSECVKRIFTNKKDPLRKNLETIIELRNISTHFITEDYESIYAPLFQANVFNFINKTSEFHDVNFSDSISTSFLNLHLSESRLTDDEIHAKYSPTVAEKMIVSRNDIAEETKETKNNNFAIPVQTSLYITKDPNSADLKVNVSKEADPTITIVNSMKDPNSSYPYRTNKVISLINRKLKRDHIKLKKYSKVKGNYYNEFTTYDFQLFAKFYGIKDNEKYCYHFDAINTYAYNQKLIKFICEEIKKDPDNIIQNLKKGIENK